MVWIRTYTDPSSEHKAGFAGSVRLNDPRYFPDEPEHLLVHALSWHSFHVTVCGQETDKYDDFHMLTNGRMETVTCLWCWTTPDPFP